MWVEHDSKSEMTVFLSIRSVADSVISTIIIFKNL